MSPLGFAWRSLTREIPRAILGIAGVAVAGALLFDMLLLSRGLVLSLREILVSAGYDARVTATRALPGAGPPVLEATSAARSIAELPEVEDVVPLRFSRAFVKTTAGAEVEIAIVGTGARRKKDPGMLEGADLSAIASASEAVVNRALVKSLGVSVGGTLLLHPRSERDGAIFPPTSFRVVGVAEFPFEATGQAAARITLDAFRRAHFGPDRDEAELLLVASRGPGGAEAAVSALRRLRPDLYSFSIEELLERLRRTDFTYFRQISFVLSVITSFFTALLVATLVTVSVNQRIGEIAMLRALGFSRLRVARDVVAEAWLLLGAGGLAALPLGFAIAFVLDSILRQIPGLPASLHFFVPTPWAVVVLVAILSATGLLAALYPVWISTRLPIAETLRKEVVS